MSWSNCGLGLRTGRPRMQEGVAFPGNGVSDAGACGYINGVVVRGDKVRVLIALAPGRHCWRHRRHRSRGLIIRGVIDLLANIPTPDTRARSLVVRRGIGPTRNTLCRKPPSYVPYKGTYVLYDGTFGAPDQGQTLDG